MIHSDTRRHERLAVRFWIGALLLFVIDCSDAVRPESSVSDARGPLKQLGRLQQVETLDEEFARLAVEVPGGFGGLVLDSTGTVVVLLADTSVRYAALERLQETMRIHLSDKLGSPAPPNVRFEVGDYVYSDLKRWRDHIDASWAAVPGLVMSDIDEATARIELGLVDPTSAGPALERVMASGGIPSGALKVVQWAAVRVSQGLNDAFNSLPGGVHVGAQGLGVCSLGVNVLYNMIPSFITASHCGITQGAVDGASWVHGGVVVGTEIADRGSLCPPFRCRWSDASIIQYNGAIPGELGFLARTTFFDSYPPDGGQGSTTIDPAQPRFPMVWPGYPSVNPVVGEYVEKVGRMTGWIHGPINKTCFSQSQNTGWTMGCTYRFNGEVIAGDSGSPVFYRIVCPGETWPVVNCATLAGIMWGQSAGQVYFSPTNNLRMDYSSASLIFVN